MAETTPAVNLNKAWLQSFLDNDVIPFAEEIKKLGIDGTAPGDSTLVVPPLVDLKEGGGAPAGFLEGQIPPLAIGLMGGSSRTNGKTVTTALNALVEQLTGILTQQGELFEELEDNLGETLEKMFKTQDENLEKIDGKEFVDFFEGVDDILSESPGSGGSDD